MVMITETTKTFTYDFPRPSVTVDVVVFAILTGKLQILLIRRLHEPFAGYWALPGGFLEIDEDIESAARRELAEETALADLYLEQLYSFGKPGRDPRGRTITVAYYALLSADKAGETFAGDDAAEAQWFGIEQLPNLAFDHDEIIRCAIERLKGKVQYTAVAFHLLPQVFTFTQLQQVYESIWQKSLDRRNFRKWINNFDMLIDTGKKQNSGRRPARLYRVNPDISAATTLHKLQNRKT